MNFSPQGEEHVPIVESEVGQGPSFSATVKLRKMSREVPSERVFPTNEQLLSPVGDNASILNWPGKSWYPMPIFCGRPSTIPVPCSVQQPLHFLPCLLLDVPL